MEFDIVVKMNIYETIAETAQAPTAAEVARALDRSIQEVGTAFQRLSQKRLLVLEPGDATRIRMAPPFSGIKTTHRVTVDGADYYANCAWDAFGVAAALGRDADITSTCPDCNRRLDLQIRDGQPLPNPAVAHFAVPAAHWWDDIIYT